MFLKNNSTFISNKILFVFLTIVIIISTISIDYIEKKYIILFLLIFSLMIFCINYFLAELPKKEFIYGLIIFIMVFLPIMTDNYYYFDEYWVFIGEKLPISSGLSLGRFFQWLISNIFSFVDFYTIKYIRCFQVFNLFLFALILYQWTLIKSKDIWLTRFFLIMVIYSSIATDTVAYAAISSYSFGLVLMSCSIILMDNIFQDNEKWGLKKIVILIISIIFIVSAYHSYQLVISVVFVFYSIEIFYSDDLKKTFICILKGLFIIFISSLIYILINKWIVNTLGIPINQRGDTLKSFSDIISKIGWFIFKIVPACINRIISTFGGGYLFQDKNFWYFLTPREKMIEIVITLKILIISLFIMGMTLSQINKKHIVFRIIISFISIPCSYFVYLLLKENGYLTYYAFPLISLIIFYIILGLQFIYNIFKKYYRCANKIKIVLGVFVFLIIIQNNIYIRNFWVIENNKSYNFIKNTIYSYLKEDKSIRKIHLYGTPYYPQSNIYSKFATILILKDLGYNPNDFHITVSDDNYFVSVFEAEDFLKITKKLSKEDVLFLNSKYSYGETYNNYSINSYEFNENDLNNLKRIFNETDIIPNLYEKNVIRIDLTWNKYL